MIATGKPWRSLGPAQVEGPHVVLVTELHLTRLRVLPTFVRHTVASVRQLSHSDGALGYALRAAPHRLRFWTLTTWADAPSIARYARARPHRDAMRWMQEGDVGEFVTTRWVVEGPPRRPAWEEALSRLGAVERPLRPPRP